MKSHHKNTPDSLHKRHYSSQLQIVREYLRKKTASRYMTAIDTEIPIQNVCRYVEMLKSSNSIAVVRKDYCRISGEMVEFLSTDPDKFPQDSQLKIWEA